MLEQCRSGEAAVIIRSDGYTASCSIGLELYIMSRIFCANRTQDQSSGCSRHHFGLAVVPLQTATETCGLASQLRMCGNYTTYEYGVQHCWRDRRTFEFKASQAQGPCGLYQSKRFTAFPNQAICMSACGAPDTPTERIVPKAGAPR